MQPLQRFFKTYPSLRKKLKGRSWLASASHLSSSLTAANTILLTFPLWRNRVRPKCRAPCESTRDQRSEVNKTRIWGDRGEMSPGLMAVLAYNRGFSDSVCNWSARHQSLLHNFFIHGRNELYHQKPTCSVWVQFHCGDQKPRVFAKLNFYDHAILQRNLVHSSKTRRRNLRELRSLPPRKLFRMSRRIPCLYRQYIYFCIKTVSKKSLQVTFVFRILNFGGGTV